ncbi:hypothetical protein DR60_4442 [Burkholderia pseudomallei]|nr:hypothetical protein DR60_4442 [Burkholderia pseudomallei]
MRYVFDQGNWSGWIPNDWPSSPDQPCNQPESWAWGMFPVEFAAKIMLDLLRITQNLYDYAYPPESPAARYAALGISAPFQLDQWGNFDMSELSPSLVARLQSTVAAWRHRGKPTVSEDWHRDGTDADKNNDKAACNDATMLTPLWEKASDLVQELTDKRREEKRGWEEGTKKLIERLQKRDPRFGSGESGQVMMCPEDFEAQFEFILLGDRRRLCARIMHDIAEVIELACPMAINIARAAIENQRMRKHDVSDATSLLALAKHFLNSHEGGNQPITVNKLLQLEVIEFSFDDHEDLKEDTLIELVQLSGNSASPIGGPDAARSKLRGLQLAHFAAFYKQSWRANDWIYGRLDGADRLIKVLLNPERLHRFYFGRSDEIAEEIEAIALSDLPDGPLKLELGCLWSKNAYRDRLKGELAFINDIQCPLPDSLPVCAEVITLRLHYGILREELPVLVSTIVSDQSMGADSANAGEAVLKLIGAKPGSVQPFLPEQAARCLKNGLLGSETLTDEAGSDLFTRTLAHTMATMQNTLASKAARLGPVSVVFAALKVPIIGFYLAARGLTHQSRTSATLNGAILALGTFIVMTGMAGLPGHMPQSVVTVGWALLAYGLIMATIRLPRTVGLAILVAGAYIAWHTSSVPLQWGTAIAALLAITIIMPWLQYVTGFLILILCGLWSSGQLQPFIPLSGCTDLTIYNQTLRYLHVDICMPVMKLTGAVTLSLMLAIWQATPWASRLENLARAVIWKFALQFRRAARR